MRNFMLATLTNGTQVLGKLYKGEVVAKTYANRTQAIKAQQEAGEFYVVHWRLGRVWYVALAGTIPNYIKGV